MLTWNNRNIFELHGLFSESRLSLYKCVFCQGQRSSLNNAKLEYWENWAERARTTQIPNDNWISIFCSGESWKYSFECSEKYHLLTFIISIIVLRAIRVMMVYSNGLQSTSFHTRYCIVLGSSGMNLSLGLATIAKCRQSRYKKTTR